MRWIVLALLGAALWPMQQTPALQLSARADYGPSWAEVRADVRAPAGATVAVAVRYPGIARNDVGMEVEGELRGCAQDGMRVVCQARLGDDGHMIVRVITPYSGDCTPVLVQITAAAGEESALAQVPVASQVPCRAYLPIMGRAVPSPYPSP